jgi:hypothetical protein
MAAESPSHSGVAGRAGGAPADGSAGGDVDDGATDRSPLAAGKPAAARTSAAGKLDAGPAAADSVVSANDAEVGEADNGAGFGGDNGGGFAKAGTDAPATGDESAATAGASDAQAETGAGTTAASATKPTVGARAGAGSTSRAARKKGKSRISARTDPAAPAGPPSAAAQASADGTDDEPATEPGATTGEGEGPAAAVTELPAAGSRSKVPAARSADRTVITASVDSARSADADAATDADADAATGADAAAGGAVVGVPLARQPEGTEQLSSFVGSGRPAWTPMPVQPRHFGDKGVTVLGTTLTRRQTGIALAIVLALIVGLVLIVVNVFGSGGDKKGSTTARPVATAKGTKPAAVVPTPSQRTTAAASAPATSAPVSSAPADTGWAVTLPAGWSMYRDPTGFSVPVPAGVSISHQGSEVYFRKDYRLLIVDQTDQPQPDPVADWKRQEADRSGTYQDYQRIAIVPVDYFLKAADWEFTYTTSSGNPQHVVKRGLIAGPHQAYGISWFTSPADWAAGQKDLQLIYQGFQPRR